MTKRIVSIALALVMMFACAMPAFAAVADTVEAAAIKAARAEYLAIDGHTDVDEDYTGFKVTRTQTAVDEDGKTYYIVTLRSNYVWKAIVEVRAYDILIDEGYRTENEQLAATSVIEGIFGYVIDVIMSVIDNIRG